MVFWYGCIYIKPIKNKEGGGGGGEGNLKEIRKGEPCLQSNMTNRGLVR